MSAWAIVAALFTLAAAARVALRPRPTLGKPRRGVVLLRPVDAPTDGELENLAIELEGVEQLSLSPLPYEGRGRPFLASDPSTHNRKLGHLQLALGREKQPGPILIADADVAVDDALVDALLSALEAGADLAWAAPHPTTRGLTRGLLVQSLHSFEVLAAMALGAPPICGKAMALSPRAAEALRRLPDCIGEDLELARVLHAQGLPIVQAGRALMPHASDDVLARFTRWMQVLKAHRPALFPSIPLLFACTPLVLLSGNAPAIATLLAARLTLACVLERRPGLFVSWLGAEALLLVCWARALLAGRTVTWRGRRLTLGAHGALR